MALDNHADRRNGAARWVANISTASTSLQYISAAVISILYYCRYVLGVACDVGMTSAGMGAGSALGLEGEVGRFDKSGPVIGERVHDDRIPRHRRRTVGCILPFGLRPSDRSSLRIPIPCTGSCAASIRKE